MSEEGNSIFKSNQKLTEGYEIAAKLHLDSVSAECENEKCNAVPTHKYLLMNTTKENLFANFKEFYWEKNKKKLDMTFSAYKRSEKNKLNK